MQLSTETETTKSMSHKMLWTESITHAGAHHMVFFIKIVSGAVVTKIVQRNEQRQTACYVLQMGLSECLPLKVFSEKFICHVLELSGCQWFFKCIQHFLPCSHPVRWCWWSSTRNLTYVRRQNTHPAHVQHVSQGGDQPKQIARGKNMSPSSDHWQTVKDWSSQIKFLSGKKQSFKGSARQWHGKEFASSNTVERKWR